MDGLADGQIAALVYWCGASKGLSALVSSVVYFARSGGMELHSKAHSIQSGLAAIKP